MAGAAPGAVARRGLRPDRGALSSRAPAKSTKACGGAHVERRPGAGCRPGEKRLRDDRLDRALAGPSRDRRHRPPTDMMRCDAEWLGRTLAGLSAEELSPILNLGASTRHFRQVEQPYIDELVFRPLEARGVRVVHCDL